MGDDAPMPEQTPGHTVRSLGPDDFRTASTVFRASLHHQPASDAAWAKRGDAYEEGRVLGAFRGDTMVGTALSYGGRLAVPGGAIVPMAMVTGVGVRADETRRGVLTSLMRTQLGSLAEPVASLRASEAGIYGRFGYGVATRGRTVRIDRGRAVLRPGAPGTTGSARLLSSPADAWQVLPPLYDSLTERRPGWSARPAGWWAAIRTWVEEGKDINQAVIHSGPDGDDGFVAYHVQPGHRAVLEVDDFCADGPESWAALWRFLLAVDLVDEIRAPLRPLDEPLEPMFVDRRVVETTAIDDETWLRLVDVPAALAARTWGELAPAVGSVVIEVRDPLLPANSGRYRISDGTARVVADPAELTMDVDVLAALYLGDVAPSALAAAGRITVDKSDALPVADRLFGIAGSPWCGTFF